MVLQCDVIERKDDRTNHFETPDALRGLDITVSTSLRPPIRPGSMFHTPLFEQDSKPSTCGCLVSSMDTG